MAGQVWGTDNLGGYMYSDSLSKKLRTALQPLVRFRPFCDAKVAKGKSKGDKFNWNVYSKVATAGAVLTEGTAIPETQFTITQASLTITEYGNSVPFSSKLDDLSEHPVTEIIHKVLKNDARDALDSAAHTEFVKSKVRVKGTGTGTAAAIAVTEGADNIAAVGPNVALETGHVKLLADELAERGRFRPLTVRTTSRCSARRGFGRSRTSWRTSTSMSPKAGTS